MANVGSAAAGKTLIAAGQGVSPTFASIGTNSGLTANGVVIAQNNGAFQATSSGNAGQLFVSNGASNPSFQDGGTVFVAHLTGTTGGQLNPTNGNFNLLGGTSAAGTTPVAIAGVGSTLTTNVQRSQAIAAADSTKVGLAAFSSTNFAVDANGFVTLVSGGFTWTDVTSATQTLVAENGYLTDRGGGVVYTLPATASIGDTIRIVGKLGLATITPNANQQILSGSASGTVGVTGTMVSNNVGDCITLVCTTSGASSFWRAESIVGTWTLN